jgi:hypothetical protein
MGDNMARKKKKTIKQYKVVFYMCRRCGFEGEELLDDIHAEVSFRAKMCPSCHTHLPSPQVWIIDEEE